MPTILKHESLFYTGNGSDKQFDLQIEQDQGIYQTRAYWGPRGSLRSNQTIYTGSDLTKATDAYSKKFRSKEVKGYTLDPSGVPFAPPPANLSGTSTQVAAVPGHSGIQPMLLSPIDRHQTKDLLKDDNWVMQAKYDGVRQLLIKDSTGIKATNRRGQYTSMSQDLHADLDSFDDTITLDGELVAGTFYVFDILHYAGIDYASMTYLSRLGELESIFEGLSFNALQLARTEHTAQEKEAFLRELAAQNAEGAVFKRIQAEYQEGVRSPHAVKFKFWETATCRVSGKNVQRSINLELLNEDGTWLNVGKCTVPANHDVPGTGALVEIKYLYAYKGGSLYQPQYQGIRTDLEESAATMQQLKYKPEAASVSSS